MENIIPRISAIEIPVSDLEQSINWYKKIMGLKVAHKDAHTAMLTFNAIGVPGIFLCETQDPQMSERLHFLNTYKNRNHSVINFYTPDLEGYHNFLMQQGVEVGKLNINSGFGGFGFKDPDGNSLSACNAVQKGQVPSPSVN